MDLSENQLCRECNKRSVCATLCPEAELYAGQDEVCSEEAVLGIPADEFRPQRPMPASPPRGKHLDLLTPKIRLSEREAEFVALRLQGKSLAEIRQRMDISEKRSQGIAIRIRQKMEALHE